VIPYHALTTLFLDVGNTLVSIDFDWVAEEVSARGLPCTAAALRRAEAAARPVVSGELERDAFPSADEGFVLYLRLVLERLPAAREAGAERIEALSRALLPVLHRPGEADRLWRAVLPGVDEALARLRALGLELVVVSNADGSVERSLANLGLRHHFSHVLDSAVVGFAKPDPRIFREGLARAGAAPERTLHVGDLVHADVAGARRAGLHAALLDPYGDWPDVGCPVFPDVPALAAAIARRRAEPGS
jgi:HAD superfamily hydrolase (TIGR01509 family)